MKYDKENNPEEWGTGDSGTKEAVSGVDLLGKYEVWIQDMSGEGREYAYDVKVKQFFSVFHFVFFPPQGGGFCAELRGGAALKV